MSIEKSSKAPNLKDLCTSVLFLIFSLVGWFYLIPYTIKTPVFLAVTGSALGKDSRLFPKIAMLFLLVMSTCLLIHFLSNLAKYKKDNPGYNLLFELKQFFAHYWEDDKIVIVTLAILVAYCVSIEMLGFVVSSLLISIVINLMMGVRSWKALFLAPIILVAAVYFTFTLLLHVEFPTGIFF